MHTEVELLKFIIKSLTDNEDVQIDRRIDERGVFMMVTLPEGYMGRIIGKGGATAQSIRTILRALGTANDARYTVKFQTTTEAKSDGGTTN